MAAAPQRLIMGIPQLTFTVGLMASGLVALFLSKRHTAASVARAKAIRTAKNAQAKLAVAQDLEMQNAGETNAVARIKNKQIAQTMKASANNLHRQSIASAQDAERLSQAVFKPFATQRRSRAVSSASIPVEGLEDGCPVNGIVSRHECLANRTHPTELFLRA